MNLFYSINRNHIAAGIATLFVLLVVSVAIASIPEAPNDWQAMARKRKCDGRNIPRIDRMASQCIKFTAQASDCYARAMEAVCPERVLR